MKRYAPLLILILTFSLFAEKKDDEHLKSRVYFYKNVSEEELDGWEKDFFKDYFEDHPMSVPDIDALTDNEVNDIDIIAESIKPQKRRKPLSPRRSRKVIPEKPPVREPEEESVKEIPDKTETTPEFELVEKPEERVKKPAQKKTKPLSLSEILPETPEKHETPDNEVDRSSRIRKMKKLLKKRKGKRRIDKRF